MSTTPPLLKTYEEARLLFEAKGWGLAKAAEHLSEMREMARFHISHAKLSKKTTPGANNAIEPEVAAAVEGMETRGGYKRQTEIVTAGLRAAHGDPPVVEVDVRQLARDLRECLPASELVLKLVEALEEKVGARAASFFRQLAERLSRVSGKQIAISAESGALKVAPCDAAWGEVAINGNCWANQGDVKPPCGLLFRHGMPAIAPSPQSRRSQPPLEQAGHAVFFDKKMKLGSSWADELE